MFTYKEKWEVLKELGIGTDLILNIKLLIAMNAEFGGCDEMENFKSRDAFREWVMKVMEHIDDFQVPEKYLSMIH